jgi:hypothetical protein
MELSLIFDRLCGGSRATGLDAAVSNYSAGVYAGKLRALQPTMRESKSRMWRGAGWPARSAICTCARVVKLTFSSWNQIGQWFRHVEMFQQVADSVGLPQ